MTLRQIKTLLRGGPFAWPGGYPMYFVTVSGDVLSFEAVRNRWREVVYSHLRGLCDSWRITALEINYEDGALFCDDSGKRIPSAYAEDGND